MAIRAKLTVRDEAGRQQQPQQARAKHTPTEEEKAVRKARVEQAKDALKRSVGLRGDHVPPARNALKLYLQRLNEPNQPDDQRFAALLEAPFKVPPKKREQRY